MVNTNFVHCEIDPQQLFDLEADPFELRNLAVDPRYSDLISSFIRKMRIYWDTNAFDTAVRYSQARR